MLRPGEVLEPDCLHVYLLGRVAFADALDLQRRLVYEVGGDRSAGVLVLCEHPPTITIGRLGSQSHVLLEGRELAARGWPVRWVNRGGGCLLHAPGQLAVYPVLALDVLGLSVQGYLDRLRALLADVAREMEVPAVPGPGGLWVGGRQLAHVGVAVRDWVTYFGAALNVHPDLEPFRRVRCDGHAAPMTSLERERRTPVRPARVRQRLLERFRELFPYPRLAIFHDHPALPRKASTDAVVTNYRQSI